MPPQLAEQRRSIRLTDQGEPVDNRSTPLYHFLEQGGTTGKSPSPSYRRVSSRFSEVLGGAQVTEAAIQEYLRKMEGERIPWEHTLKEALRGEDDTDLRDVLAPFYQTQVPERIREKVTHAWMDVFGPVLCQVQMSGPQIGSAVQPAA